MYTIFPPMPFFLVLILSPFTRGVVTKTPLPFNGLLIKYIWSNYSDLIRPGPSVAEVKYYNLAILVPSKVPAQKRQRTENVFVLQRIILQNRLVGEWKV